MSRPEYLNLRITPQRRARLDALAALTASSSDADTIDAALTIALERKGTEMTTLETLKVKYGRLNVFTEHGTDQGSNEEPHFITILCKSEAQAKEIAANEGWSYQSYYDTRLNQWAVCHPRDDID